MNNRNLAVLVIGALVLSLAGTFLSMQQLSRVSMLPSPTLPAGYATSNQTGNVTLAIQGQVGCSFNNDTLIDFGSGYVQTGGFCWMYSNDSSLDGAGCVGGLTAPDASFILENTGNVPASVSAYANATPAQFLSGSLTPEFKVKVTQNESDSCPGTNLTFDSYGTLSNDSSTANITCDNLGFRFTPESSDSLAFNVYVNFSQEITTGDHKAQVTAICSDT